MLGGRSPSNWGSGTGGPWVQRLCRASFVLHCLCDIQHVPQTVGKYPSVKDGRRRAGWLTGGDRVQMETVVLLLTLHKGRSKAIDMLRVTWRQALNTQVVRGSKKEIVMNQQVESYILFTAVCDSCVHAARFFESATLVLRTFINQEFPQGNGGIETLNKRVGLCSCLWLHRYWE